MLLRLLAEGDFRTKATLESFLLWLKKLRPALGGELAAREPVWDGEGWGCDRVACPL